MSTLTFRAFLSGPGAWRSRSRWHPALAVLAAIVIIVVGQLAPIVAIAVMTGQSPEAAARPIPADRAVVELTERSAATLLLLGQSTLALLTILAAAIPRSRFSEVLGLVSPAGGFRAYVYAFLVMLPLLAAINAAAYTLSPAGFMADFKQFAALARAPEPMTAFLAIAIGAPLWEEMLFRGFLMGPLAEWLRFWPAAVLVSGAWTVLHIGYSVAGLAEVFLIGLYFSWLLQRTGSLWVPIACHAAYNGALFMAIRLLPV
ncbi:MAG: lysostaphin resistance A-like protein [Hyphomicrobiaceae bacterium]